LVANLTVCRPLAVLSLWPVAVITVLAGGLAWPEGLHRLVWLGGVPATLMGGSGGGVSGGWAHAGCTV